MSVFYFHFTLAAELTKGNPECCWPADTPADEAEEDAMHLLEVERVSCISRLHYFSVVSPASVLMHHP